MAVITIDTFEVKNYKPIQDSGPINIGDMTTFIGKNDAGKSSFLEALHIFLEGDKPDNDHFHKREAESISFIARLAEAPSELKDALSDDYLPEGDEEFTIKKEFTRREGTTPGAETYVNGEKMAKGAVVVDGDQLYKAKSRDFIWEYFPEPLPIFAERDVNEETKLKGGTFLNKLLMPVLRGGGLHDEIDEQIKELKGSLQETSEGIGDRLTEYMQSHLADVEKVNMSPGSIQISKAISPKIHLEDKHLSESIDVRERGSGVGSLLLLSMMQAYVDLQVGEGYMLLFEEPGNFLHPAAERKMLDALRSIADSGGQVMITTHSQVFIDNRADAEMYITRRDSGVTSFEHIEEDAFKAVDEIGARNSDILQSDFVIYVEGPSDVKVLEALSEAYVEDWKEHNITIQHLGGTGNMRHCEPAKLKKINRNFAFLFDSDKKAAGDDLKGEVQSIKEKSAREGIDCHVLERREIENYYHPDAIGKVLSIPISEDDLSKYCDIEQEVNRLVAQEYDVKSVSAYNKIDHGKQIIEWMYENGKSIEEIEGFLDDCVEQAKA
ncbi:MULTISPECIES: ATP-dependent nuclease [Halolamina]|uniref:Putative ATP-dependent endonuclease of the OLD family n=1 Tax=Halolamina pelagica TaxID=699431 RepID=A0A1I5T7Q3_9EURY|nr:MULTISPECIES: AAA family ATPase [Halolamina]NHX37395.1 AAA family ATPase [Halolamina sp. R1-12]SFP79062.1 putative ATP-dependent endonuclease of the OLD family [Halolamina pelagica]